MTTDEFWQRIRNSIIECDECPVSKWSKRFRRKE